MAATGEREVTLTFVMSAAEIDVWQTWSAEHSLALADAVHLAALRGLWDQSTSLGDQIKALVAQGCEREAREFLGTLS